MAVFSSRLLGATWLNNFMAVESIFARQWWAIALRGARTVQGRMTEEQMIKTLGADMAKGSGGQLHKSNSVAKPGIFIASSEASEMDHNKTRSCVSTMLFQSEQSYFPLEPENLESGPVSLDQLESCERDFPRRLGTGRNSVFQYPLLTAFSSINNMGGVFLIASPYFLLLRDIIKTLPHGRSYAACIGIDVGKVFSKLEGLTLKNGELTVRSGRMIITGIDYLRSAVFFGDNVVRSPLYSDLVGRKGVTVNPKDCRLGRTFVEPVGGNRRAFICWFDPHGNYRFTPGTDSVSTVTKFFELLEVLASLKLSNDADSFNPLARIRRGTPSE
jgi:hypothetical protein